MNRRDFIKTISATAILAGLGFPSKASSPTDKPHIAVTGNLEDAYRYAAKALNIPLSDVRRWEFDYQHMRFSDPTTRLPYWIPAGEGKYGNNPDWFRAKYQMDFFGITEKFPLSHGSPEFRHPFQLVMFERGECDPITERRDHIKMTDGYISLVYNGHGLVSEIGEPLRWGDRT